MRPDDRARHRMGMTTREIVTAYLRAIEAHRPDEAASYLHPEEREGAGAPGVPGVEGDQVAGRRGRSGRRAAAGEGHPEWRIVRTGTLLERTTRSATLPTMR